MGPVGPIGPCGPAGPVTYIHVPAGPIDPGEPLIANDADSTVFAYEAVSAY